MSPWPGSWTLLVSSFPPCTLTPPGAEGRWFRRQLCLRSLKGTVPCAGNPPISHTSQVSRLPQGGDNPGPCMADTLRSDSVLRATRLPLSRRVCLESGQILFSGQPAYFCPDGCVWSCLGVTPLCKPLMSTFTPGGMWVPIFSSPEGYSLNMHFSSRPLHGIFVAVYTPPWGRLSACIINVASALEVGM